jgi:hypothetical protein
VGDVRVHPNAAPVRRKALVKRRRRGDDTHDVTATTGPASAGETAASASAAAATAAVTSAWPGGAFAGYPHVANCPNCRRYAVEWDGYGSGLDLVTATLAYHASCHTFDPVTTASQHFAAPG